MRRLPRALRVAGLAALLVGWVPGEARGPLDGEPMVAGVQLFYGPRTPLHEVDAALIAAARERIDVAAYILTDRAVMDAFAAAARRGVKVRLYLDPDQPGGSGAAGRAALAALLAVPGVEARVKTAGELMHLKAYQVDGRVLRTGSANFSVSGGRRQENDVVVIRSREAAGVFVREFEYLWTRPDSVRYRPEAEEPGREQARGKGRT